MSQTIQEVFSWLWEPDNPTLAGVIFSAAIMLVLAAKLFGWGVFKK